jgi:hypothetical protein
MNARDSRREGSPHRGRVLNLSTNGERHRTTDDLRGSAQNRTSWLRFWLGNLVSRLTRRKTGIGTRGTRSSTTGIITRVWVCGRDSPSHGVACQRAAACVNSGSSKHSPNWHFTRSQRSQTSTFAHLGSPRTPRQRADHLHLVHCTYLQGIPRTCSPLPRCSVQPGTIRTLRPRLTFRQRHSRNILNFLQ